MTKEQQEQTQEPGQAVPLQAQEPEQAQAAVTRSLEQEQAALQTLLDGLTKSVAAAEQQDGADGVAEDTGRGTAALKDMAEDTSVGTALKDMAEAELALGDFERRLDGLLGRLDTLIDEQQEMEDSTQQEAREK
ncbi:hypothetical protein GGF46_004560 [Coemansia sp. RSA 552]|nr:hypothetical protein GGF46_004560 [Coemansia sp. RSA 552]